MRFRSSTGSFELSIVADAPPAAPVRSAGSLYCQLSTAWRQRVDHQLTPLRAWEVRRLLGGLRSLWNRAARHVSLTFAQPELSFDASVLPDLTYRLRIQVGDGLRPEGYPYPDFPLELDLVLNRTQLAEAIEDLSNQLVACSE